MSIVTLTALKAYFETGDFPTQQQFIDLIDTLGQQNNLRTVEYTVGVFGVAGVDYNFTSVANTTEQSIQLGGTDFIPIYSAAAKVVVICTDGLSGAITGTCHVGFTSGAEDIANVSGADDTGEGFIATVLGGDPTAAQSIWFSITPSANWNTITNGSWKIWITYIDNSLL